MQEVVVACDMVVTLVTHTIAPLPMVGAGVGRHAPAVAQMMMVVVMKLCDRQITLWEVALEGVIMDSWFNREGHYDGISGT